MNASLAPSHALQTARIRLLLIAIVFIVALVGVAGRLVQLNLKTPHCQSRQPQSEQRNFPCCAAILPTATARCWPPH